MICLIYLILQDRLNGNIGIVGFLLFVFSLMMGIFICGVATRNDLSAQEYVRHPEKMEIKYKYEKQGDSLVVSDTIFTIKIKP